MRSAISVLLLVVCLGMSYAQPILSQDRDRPLASASGQSQTFDDAIENGNVAMLLLSGKSFAEKDGQSQVTINYKLSLLQKKKEVDSSAASFNRPVESRENMPVATSSDDSMLSNKIGPLLSDRVNALATFIKQQGVDIETPQVNVQPDIDHYANLTVVSAAQNLSFRVPTARADAVFRSILDHPAAKLSGVSVNARSDAKKKQLKEQQQAASMKQGEQPSTVKSEPLSRDDIESIQAVQSFTLNVMSDLMNRVSPFFESSTFGFFRFMVGAPEIPEENKPATLHRPFDRLKAGLSDTPSFAPSPADQQQPQADQNKIPADQSKPALPADRQPPQQPAKPLQEGAKINKKLIAALDISVQGSL